MTRVIIDASVAIKWVVEEAGSREAVALRRHQLAAPELMVAECANILWKKVKRGELTVEEASLAARLLERSGVDPAPMNAMLERATAIAVMIDHPAYDCIYLALAEATESPLVTADERLARKVASTKGLAMVVIALADAGTLS